MGIRIRGARELKRNLRRYTRRAPGALGAALYQEAEAIMAESKKQVPVDTGRLRSTGYVAAPVFVRRSPRVEMGYGTDYAVYVHERTELHHTVGKAKYLEDPLKAATRGFVRRLAARTRQNLERGLSLPIRGE